MRIFFTKNVSHLIFTQWNSLSVIEDKTESRKIHQKVATNGSWSIDLANYIPEGSSAFCNVHQLLEALSEL